MLACTILGIAQDMNFAENVTTTYLSLQLPNGTVVQAAVDETTAAAVIEQQLATSGLPRAATHAPRPAAPRMQVPTSEALQAAAPASTGEDPHADYDEPPDNKDLRPVENGTFVFGGQDTGPALTPEEQEALAEGSPTFVDAGPPASPDQALAVNDAPLVPHKQSLRAPSRSRAQKLANGKIVVPSVTVQPNEKGYPRVRDGVDTSELTGGREPDENGVGSV